MILLLEIPEAAVLARQINETLTGKTVVKVEAASSPHKFAWYCGDPQNYQTLLAGKTIGVARAHAGMVEISADDVSLVLGDGVGFRYHAREDVRPQKHQLLIQFDDSSAASASVQMYGGIWCFRSGEFDNIYFAIAKEKPSPLSARFDSGYFSRLIAPPDVQKLSAKAFLATEQRIPGLGNGVLQDVLWNAGIRPTRKINTLSDEDRGRLFESVKKVLLEMTKLGGRDTEKDLFGENGGYKTVMSKNTAGRACPACGGPITKGSYLGGSVYYCDQCQKL